MSAHKTLTSFIGDHQGPTVRLAPDVRRLAGFDPSIVVDFILEPNQQDLYYERPFCISSAGRLTEVQPGRIDNWTPDSGLVKAAPTHSTRRFPPISQQGQTTYKLYFRLRPAEIVIFRFPTLHSGSATLDLPAFELATAERTTPVLISQMEPR